MLGKESALPVWLKAEYMKLPERHEAIGAVWMGEGYKEAEKSGDDAEEGGMRGIPAECNSAKNGTLSEESVFVTPKCDLTAKWELWLYNPI